METVQFIGLKDLEDVDQEMVRKITAEHYPKIQRALNNETALVIHIKVSAKEGHRQRYDVHVRAVAPTKIFESSSEEWDLAATLQDCLKNILTQIGHTFHD